MWKNYLKIALRNQGRHRSYTLINVLGLALGMTCGMLIFSLVKYHLSFDNFHQDADRIYRFVTEQHREDVSYRASVPNPFGKVFREDYTYGEKVARICTFDEQLISLTEGSESRRFKEKEIAFVETEFFDIFNYPLLQGDFSTALQEPNTALITERVARKYFGNAPAIGKSFRLDNRIEVKVTGVLKNFPENTDRHTEIYLSYPTLKTYDEWFGSDDSWGGMSTAMQCFVRLRPGVTPGEVEAVLPAYVKKYRPDNKNVHHYKLQALNDMHFNAHYGGVMEKSNLWILSIIGLFLILTACVNFINLATAQALKRAREVGVRKVLGSLKSQLFWQFITETVLITGTAAVLALALSQMALPYVNSWFDAQISSNILVDWQLMLFLPLLILLVTLLSGSYPGLVLAGFSPITALKGKLSQQQIGGFNTRRVLIVTQFAISQLLIISLLVIIYQMRYAKQSDLGFNKDAVVLIPVGSTDDKMKTLQQQFEQIAGVENTSLCFAAPSSADTWGTSIRYEGRMEDEVFSIHYRGADDHYLATFNLQLVAGRNLLPSDTTKEFLVNETTVRKLNLQSPEDIIGKSIAVNGGQWTGPVVGVVKDFHDESFHEDIHAVFISSQNDSYNAYAVKIPTTNVKNTLAALEKTWSGMYPDQVYEYAFLDEKIAEFYVTEETMLKLIQAFSLIAILIGCMGLYGLVAFMANQKTKEIGIRKILGSTIPQILWIFGEEFLRLILCAFLVAAPVGWWLMSNWLQDFPYHIEINAWVFVPAIALTVLITFLTVGFQSAKAALANPVQSLRSE